MSTHTPSLDRVYTFHTYFIVTLFMDKNSKKDGTMFKRIFNKNVFIRLLKAGGLFLLLWMTLMIGYALGEANGRIRSENNTSIVVDMPERPTMPRRPDRPQLPELPDMPVRPTLPNRIPSIDRVITIEQGPSLLSVFSTVSNVLIGLALMGLGIVMIRKHDRQPKEKTPDSLAR